MPFPQTTIRTNSSCEYGPMSGASLTQVDGDVHPFPSDPLAGKCRNKETFPWGGEPWDATELVRLSVCAGAWAQGCRAVFFRSHPEPDRPSGRSFPTSTPPLKSGYPLGGMSEGTSLSSEVPPFLLPESVRPGLRSKSEPTSKCALGFPPPGFSHFSTIKDELWGRS